MSLLKARMVVNESRSMRQWAISIVLILVAIGGPKSADGGDVEEAFAAQSNLEHHRAVELFGAAIASGDLSGDELAGAYFGRGSTLAVLGDLERALNDFDRALALRPRHAAAYYRRGTARFLQGWYAGALADFSVVATLEPELEYTTIWQYLSATRVLGESRANLMRESAGQSQWPGPLLKLLLGKISTDTVFDAAGQDPERARDRRCEATFYIGHTMLLDGRRGAARMWFERATDLCPTTFIEHSSARVELRTLDRLQARRGDVYLTTNRVSYRSGPGEEHTRIGVMSAGREVRVIAVHGAWYRVELPDGASAYVHRDYLRKYR